jgi:diguanylate cyclase (GGDEF)-like protein
MIQNSTWRLFIGYLIGIALASLMTPSAACAMQEHRAISVTDDRYSQRLSKQLMILEDATDELALNDVIAAAAQGKFKPVDGNNLQMGYNSHVFWIKLQVHNGLKNHTAQNSEDRFYISVDYPLLDNVEFFHIRDQQTRSMVTGDLYDFSQRYFSLNNYVFPIALKPAETGDIYIRIFSSSSLSIPITLQAERAFVESQFKFDSLNGIYLGITLGLGIYNLFLWLGVRKAVYGLYVLLVLSLMLFNTTILGFTFRLWPGGIFFQQISVYVFSFTSGILVIVFGMAYLDTKNTQPIFHRMLWCLVGICALSIPAVFFLPIVTSAKLTAFTSMIAAVSLIFVALRSVFNGYKPAIYYTIGQGAVIVSVLFTALTSQKIIPYYHLAPDVMKWCSAFELIFFSIGLADLVNNERRLREQAQKESVEAQKKLLNAQIELNQDLDILVRERTDELEKANLQLRDLNTTDELTALRNRRYLNEALPKEYQRAYRDKVSISVLILDIDFFKQLNDNYGHQFGDHCLAETGRLLSQCIRRPPDIAVRYGGEEFVIVLPNTDQIGAVMVAQTIRQTFEQHRIEHGKHQTGLTVSVGLASEIPAQRDGYENLLRRADDMLYQAKAKGRNRVEWVNTKPDSSAAVSS